MKNCDEMVNSLLERRDRYVIEQKRKRTKITRTVTTMCCVCFVALMGFGAWQGGLINSALQIMTNYNGKQNHSSETDNNPTVSDSIKVFNVISLSQGNTGEFAADMHRPEGFSDNIGSVLALKMSIVDDAEYKFPVIVCIPDDMDLEQMINDANSKVDKAISIAEISSVSIDGKISLTGKYYHLLTAEQIVAIADGGAKCCYVGSGEGDHKNINWDTVEGINVYCELYGDMYIAGDNNVEYTPDIVIE